MAYKITEQDRHFTQGYVCCLANLIRLDGINTDKREAFKALGRSIWQIEKRGCDPNDVLILKQHKKYLTR